VSAYLFKRFIADQKFIDAPWSGCRDGRWCRCYLCGRFFVAGDPVRSIYSNYPGSPFCGNPFVCDTPTCGGEPRTDLDILNVLGARLKQIPWWGCRWGIEPRGRYEQPKAAARADHGPEVR